VCDEDSAVTRARPFDEAWLEQDLEKLIESLALSEQQQHFMRSRWLENILWMEAAARRTRNRYYALRLIVVVGAVIVPALVGLNAIGAAKAAINWIVFGLSLVVGVCAAVEGFFRLGERWRHYRSSVETSKAEGWSYAERSGVYEPLGQDHEAAFALFVSRVQAILAHEVEEYVTEIAKRSDQGAPVEP
jgi:hypothetical protein